MGLELNTVNDAIENITTMVPRLSNSIEDMRNLKLSTGERNLLADGAKVARWGKSSTVDATQLLTPRRQEDLGHDLWTTFNVIQENTIRGGFRGETQKRTSRELTNMDALGKVNMALWSQAESLLQTA